MTASTLRKKLVRWYQANRRDLPWRRTRDPYAIWISEIMLQQTRVAAAIPYYERFLARFPNAAELAQAEEAEVLALWSGLGYYSRARNLHQAAKKIVAAGGFPRDYAAIRELPGIGDYTAAAVASIAYGLPYAVVDGNVRRVAARLTNSADPDAQEISNLLLDRRNPGQSNQALMELGAVVCLPRAPLCEACPLKRECEAQKHGTQAGLPPKRARPEIERIRKTLLLIERRGKILLVPSARVRGFWDLPEPFKEARPGRKTGEFRHTILHRQYQFEVHRATASKIPKDAIWWAEGALIPLSTTAQKALRRSQ